MVSINILKTKNFLGIFNIETGGIFIGLAGLFWAIAQLVAEIILILSLAVVEDFCLERQIFYAEETLGNYSEDFKNFTEFAQQGLQDLTYQAQEALFNVTNTKLSCTQISKIRK
ncbi:hypothetical protein PVAND_016173 [Polypedilum vanderplanki]|uniref:Uncharacterized protein n=1 Tax=Polypedilum vanderplanki TaxID=319348 RepID=A0A9J6BEB9_POLVA|nr:hypothetical protein PVAND_016173 [Polypedilum vanderplanki]